MILFNIAKFLLGFILAIALLVGGGVAAALYFMNKVSTHPPKPIFPNDKPMLKDQRPPNAATAKSTRLLAAKPSPTLSRTQTSSPKPIEPGAYKARIIWPHGLSLRSQPNVDGEHIGSLSYNQPIVVLEQSADKNWQRIRLKGSNREGWIKAGNTQPVEKQQ
jgi:hypothetical protein